MSDRFSSYSKLELDLILANKDSKRTVEDTKVAKRKIYSIVQFLQNILKNYSKNIDFLTKSSSINQFYFQFYS